ncbi:MAG: CRISPR-associated endonuclease Cas1, partial [Candidatus Bipolaricaulota bacterium]|nr:CRISPR-associated endonuclease Cas1 [Candidatus Bipolaricaulota bacterium]MDW7967305.1 CRISPR-associated endonuclease Cas1 [Thermoanaerobaculum sp.]MDW8127524.1 CRISPR-associated endonuclease Cas1 [Candidatus Bipolaricaulota bacterium]
LVIQQPGSWVSLDGNQLVVRTAEGEEDRVGLESVSQLVLMGSVSITTPALHRCLDDLIPVVFLSGGGWFYGYARGLSHKNCALRVLQYEKARDPDTRSSVNATLVANKIANCRTLLRRNGKVPTEVLDQLSRLSASARSCRDDELLLSLEGQAARLYFQHFASMLKNEAALSFAFEDRHRRPPTDPVNALLSFVYTLLLKDWTITLETVGFDPFFGFYHAPRHGKPALALDLMEPFRPVVAESVVITLLNNRELAPKDFIEREGACLIRAEARKKVVQAYLRRLMSEISHPVFGYRVTYRRLFEIHARLFARYLFGEIPNPPEFQIR